MKALTIVIFAAFVLTGCVSREGRIARIKSEVAKIFAEEHDVVRFEARLKKLGARMSAGTKPGERVAEIPLIVRTEYSKSLLVKFRVERDGRIDLPTCEEAELIVDSRSREMPNKALQPTTTAVTIRARARLAPAAVVADL